MCPPGLMQSNPCIRLWGLKDTIKEGFSLLKAMAIKDQNYPKLAEGQEKTLLQSLTQNMGKTRAFSVQAKSLFSSRAISLCPIIRAHPEQWMEPILLPCCLVSFDPHMSVPGCPCQWMQWKQKEQVGSLKLGSGKEQTNQKKKKKK